MRPPPRQKIDYEKVKADEWVVGTIQDVQYEAERTRTFEGKTSVGPAIRFKFAFQGCEFPHYSRWMTFSLGEKATLYKKYVFNLIENATADMDLELDVLKGMPIKTMWSNNGDFQNLEMIRPLTTKLKIVVPVEADEPPEVVSEEHGEDVPF